MGARRNFDAEEVARLVERRMGGFRLDQVGSSDVALLAGVLPVGEDGVQDAARSAGRHQARRGSYPSWRRHATSPAPWR